MDGTEDREELRENVQWYERANEGCYCDRDWDTSQGHQQGCPMYHVRPAQPQVGKRIVESKLHKCTSSEVALKRASDQYKLSVELFSCHGNVTLQYQEHNKRIIIVDYRNTYGVQNIYEWE